MEKKNLQEWKKMMLLKKESFLFFCLKRQTYIFLFLLFFVVGIGCFLWFTYWYSLGKNSSMIENFLKEKKEVQFEEFLYTKIEEEEIFREKQSELEIQGGEIFIPLPERFEE
ncbi:MAG: hypothetical protein EOM19_02620 [Candidatus Moranbacteria bacterium]|nr:hypothetical protein [Candidatus Moranbacteria bacterium]